MKIQDNYLIHHVELLFEKKIVIYGTGSSGKTSDELLKSVGIDTWAYADSNEIKWGEKISSYGRILNILSYNKLKELLAKNEIIIIIASIYFDEIIENLNKQDFCTEYIYTDFALKYCIYFNIYNPLFSSINRSFILKNIEIQKKVSNLSVQESRYRFAHNILEDLGSYSDESLFVYQPGKVGSSTIYDYIKDMITNKVFHLHIFPYKQLKQYVNDNEIKNLLMSKKIKIISLVREPIGRDISGFFHRLLLEIKDNIYLNYIVKSQDFVDLYFRILQDKLYHDYDFFYINDNQWDDIDFSNNGGGMTAWFNNELKRYFNIDIFSYPFDKNKGYTIIEKGNIKVLLMKLEALNNLYPVIAEFLEVKEQFLNLKNSAEQKVYKYIYKEFKQDVKLTQEYIDYYYKDNKYIKHFYTSDEILEFYNKWKPHIK